MFRSTLRKAAQQSAQPVVNKARCSATKTALKWGLYTAPVTVPAIGYVGYNYYVNGQAGTKNLLTHPPNPILVPQHKKFVEKLINEKKQNDAKIAQEEQDGNGNNNIHQIKNFDPATITPDNNEYTFKLPPKREETLKKMQTDEFDLLIIGAGISGTAAAHEATTRGFKVALVDKGDFASCTSSRSTKLIHGGVRYLEQAFTQLDFPLLGLVSEALHERSHMIKSAPYMNEALPIIIPLTKWWELPYMGAGIFLYDLFAMFEEFPRAYPISLSETQKIFPQLDTDKLGVSSAIVYFDGQMNDARHTMSLALTAQEQGATVSNYLEVVSLHHDNDGNLIGATVQDKIDEKNEPFFIKCKSILNAAGPYADKIRQMDDPNAQDLIVPSAGTHVVLPQHCAPKDYGLLVPKTPDGRVLFLLPWEDNVIAGTTDAQSDICDVPIPAQNDIEYIADIVNGYVKQEIDSKKDIQSAWSGLRPLVKDPTIVGNTKKLSRNHLVLPTPSHMVSLMGGKYTTHRQMAQDAIDVVIQNNQHFVEKSNSINDDANIIKRKSSTFNVPIYGADDAEVLLKGDFNTLRPVLEHSYNIAPTQADYLTRNYGTRALPIAQNAYKQCMMLYPETTMLNKKTENNNNNLHEKCIMNAEIDYNIDFELAVRAEDVLFRRNRMGFVNTKDVDQNVNSVIDYMGKKLNWDVNRKNDENKRVGYLLDRMDYSKLQNNDKK